MCGHVILWTISPRVRHERTGFVTPLSVLCGASWSEIGRGGQHVLSITGVRCNTWLAQCQDRRQHRRIPAMSRRCTTHHPPPTGFRSPPRRAPLDDQRGQHRRRSRPIRRPRPAVPPRQHHPSVMRSATGGGSSLSSAGVASTVALPGDGGVVCLCHSPNFGEGVRIGHGDGRLHRESWVQECRHR